MGCQFWCAKALHYHKTETFSREVVIVLATYHLATMQNSAIHEHHVLRKIKPADIALEQWFPTLDLLFFVTRRSKVSRRADHTSIRGTVS